jgi:hypothetical protein
VLEDAEGVEEGDLAAVHANLGAVCLHDVDVAKGSQVGSGCVHGAAEANGDDFGASGRRDLCKPTGTTPRVNDRAASQIVRAPARLTFRTLARVRFPVGGSSCTWANLFHWSPNDSL